MLAAAVTAIALAAPLSSGGATRGGVPRLIFPVVGPVSYTNDFGDPRPGGPHQGNDIMGIKKSPVVAVEAGTIEFWTHSASAGCMLYLHGRSGTVYQYIHLNNDLTMRNDNRGRCVPGIAYAKGLRNGAHVQAGQPIGYLGDSGDANGIHPHLHFEVHPHDGSAVSPYPYLRRAQVLLFATKLGARISLTLEGTLVSSDSTDGSLSMTLTGLSTSTGVRLANLSRKLTLRLSPATLVLDRAGNHLDLSSLDSLAGGEPIEIATTSAPATLAGELCSPLALTTFSVTIPNQ